MSGLAVPRSIDRSLEKNLPKPNMKQKSRARGGPRGGLATIRKARQCMNPTPAKQGKMPLRAVSVACSMRSKTGEDEAVRRIRCDKVLSLFPPRSDMPIDPATVRRIARLARLSVDDAHVDAVAGELDRVLHMAGALQKADLDGVEPLAHPHEQALALR